MGNLQHEVEGKAYFALKNIHHGKLNLQKSRISDQHIVEAIEEIKVIGYCLSNLKSINLGIKYTIKPSIESVMLGSNIYQTANCQIWLLSNYSGTQLENKEQNIQEIGQLKIQCFFIQVKYKIFSKQQNRRFRGKAYSNGPFQNLRTLNLNGNLIGNEGVRAVSNGCFSNLMDLSLGNNTVTDEGACHIKNGPFQSLKILSLYGNRINDKGCISLVGYFLPDLDGVYLNGNNFLQETRKRIQSFQIVNKNERSVVFYF